MRKNEIKKRKFELFFAVIFTAVILTGGTFAWFTRTIWITDYDNDHVNDAVFSGKIDETIYEGYVTISVLSLQDQNGFHSEKKLKPLFFCDDYVCYDNYGINSNKVGFVSQVYDKEYELSEEELNNSKLDISRLVFERLSIKDANSILIEKSNVLTMHDTGGVYNYVHFLLNDEASSLHMNAVVEVDNGDGSYSYFRPGEYIYLQGPGSITYKIYIYLDGSYDNNNDMNVLKEVNITWYATEDNS